MVLDMLHRDGHLPRLHAVNHIRQPGQAKRHLTNSEQN